ncbi:recombinase family protein [Streptomyces sp. NPDC101062]|uniref:recombinase family protein n=1 Tax=unclassified Streptomyces TaxID=2593676 RepID=UPI003825016D
MIETSMYDTPETTPYDGCGKCLVATRRLSRRTDTTHSPGKQRDKILGAADSVGGHVIAWADDWEVSGSTDPTTRPQFGPWLRGEMGPYDGIVGAAVDRIGRNLRDVLNTAYSNHELGRILVTADHVGIWDLNDPGEESDLAIRALGAQMEHRNIRTRNRDETTRSRDQGRKRGPVSYGYRYIRKTALGKALTVGLDDLTFENDPGGKAVEIARNMADRYLTDETGLITPSSEAAIMTRAGILSPMDRRRVQYGREPKGTPWTDVVITHIFSSEASLGLLMHDGKPVIGEDGKPIQIAPPLWSPETRRALLAKLRAHGKGEKRKKERAPRSDYMCISRSSCGNCGFRIYIGGSPQRPSYTCKARSKGIVAPETCPISPTMLVSVMDAKVGEWFLLRHGNAEIMRSEFIPGTGHAARISELEENRKRLREDRNAGLYNSSDDAEWYRFTYKKILEEIEEIKDLPELPPRIEWVPTGRTVAQEWNATKDSAKRRELLAKFDVKIELRSTGLQKRLKITSINPYSPIEDETD